MLSLELEKLLVFAEQVGVDLSGLSGDVLSRRLLLPQFGEHRVLLSLESVELSSKLLIQLSLIPQVLLQVFVDHVLDLAHFVKFPFQIICEPFLVSQLASDVTLLVRCLLQLGEHEVEPLHQALLVLLEHHDLVFVLLMRLIQLPVMLQRRPIVLNRLKSLANACSFPIQFIYSVWIYKTYLGLVIELQKFSKYKIGDRLY